MSRIGKRLIAIPEGVKIELDGSKVVVTGPKGTLDFIHRPEVKVEISEDGVKVSKKGNAKKIVSLWGTTSRVIENMIVGVTEGFSKQLELNGVGFRMNLQGKKLNLALGFSHPVDVEIPEGIEVSIEGNTMNISGIEKQKVGQFAADIRALKPVEPYKAKGFKYSDEVVRRKEGKKAAAE